MSARTFETVGDLAAATIDVLDERGWCQGVLVQPDGRVCTVEAIAAASGTADSYGCRAAIAIERVLAGHLRGDIVWDAAVAEATASAAKCATTPWGGEVSWVLWRWNDDPRTTAEDVKLALKHAAESTEPCPDLTIAEVR